MRSWHSYRANSWWRRYYRLQFPASNQSGIWSLLSGLEQSGWARVEQSCRWPDSASVAVSGADAMTRILAITNQKGGVGKTTTSVNLAASLAAARRRVLLVDLDPQGNATMGSGVDKRSLPHTVYQVLLGSRSVTEVSVHSTSGKYDLVPANRELAGAEIEMVDLPQRETRLKEALR